MHIRYITPIKKYGRLEITQQQYFNLLPSEAIPIAEFFRDFAQGYEFDFGRSSRPAWAAPLYRKMLFYDEGPETAWVLTEREDEANFFVKYPWIAMFRWYHGSPCDTCGFPKADSRHVGEAHPLAGYAPAEGFGDPNKHGQHNACCTTFRHLGQKFPEHLDRFNDVFSGDRERVIVDIAAVDESWFMRKKHVPETEPGRIYAIMKYGGLRELSELVAEVEHSGS
jgi:hypothetical protein